MMTSRSKIGESLLRTIEGGKRPENDTDESGTRDEFDQALSSESESEFGKNSQDPIQLSNSEEIDDVHREPVHDLNVLPATPERVSKSTQKKVKTPISGVGVAALLISLVAVAIGTFSVVSQKQFIASNDVNRDSVEQAIGSLTTKTDSLSVEVKGAQKEITLNSEAISSLESLSTEMAGYKASLEAMRSNITELKKTVDSNSKAIGEQQLSIASAKETLDQLSNKLVIQRQPVRKAPQVRTDINTTTTLLEGASVASIDSWGTQTNVMLKESNGNWLPLSEGDYFKGWRLEGTEAGVAVFRRGDKTTKVIVEQ
jgi:hypothetical protein